MIHIFYLIAIPFFIYKVGHFVNPNRQVKMMKKSKSRIEAQKKNLEMQPYSDKEIASIQLKFFFIVWLLLGLFTEIWFLFLSVLFFNMFIMNMISSMTDYSNTFTKIYKINSLLTAFWSLFVIIDHYHLKNDFLTYFFN